VSPVETGRTPTGHGLEGSTAIVTGGAQGIGRNYCLALAAAGANIVVADLVSAEEVVAEAQALGVEAFWVRTDVSDQEATTEMAAEAISRFGRIDVLVNNAGYFKHTFRGSFDEIEVEEWDKAFAVNTRGVWLCCKAVIPHMRRRSYGKIVNISSNTVWRGVPNFLHYVASKSALTGLTRAMANEVGGDNICVNTLAPDYIADDFLREMEPGREDQIAAQRALKRPETPEDMEGALLFLAGRGSDFVTGQVLLVNGGFYFH
jgi:3-oxoacyl-[acyl-carrier protein] reductase